MDFGKLIPCYRDPVPCTAHSLVTTHWLGARTFGCAVVLVSLTKKEGTDSARFFLPTGVLALWHAT